MIPLNDFVVILVCAWGCLVLLVYFANKWFGFVVVTELILMLCFCSMSPLFIEGI